jgi:hypothetical protein
MLTRLVLENFKGISDPVEIPIRPITLLFGANSAGKSTVLQALLYAYEVFHHHNLDPDRSCITGESVDLGGFLNLVHGHDPGREIRMSFEMDTRRTSLLWPRQPTQDPNWDVIVPFLERTLTGETATVSFAVSWNHVLRLPYVSAYSVEIDGHLVATIATSTDGVTAIRNYNHCHPRLLAALTDAEMPVGAGDYLDSYCDNVGDGAREIPLTAWDVARLADPKWFPRDFPVLSPFDSLPSWDRFLEFPPTGGPVAAGFQPGQCRPANRERVGSQVVYEYASNTIPSLLLMGPGLLLREDLKALRYIGPLRQTPPRIYEVPRHGEQGRWGNGLAAWDRLLTDDNDLVAETSRWLSDSAKLGAGYSLRRSRSLALDPDDPALVELTGEARTRILGEKLAAYISGLLEKRVLHLIDIARNLDVFTHDVGTGVSQLVPVVVGLLDPETKLLAVEQPELHLHPALQARLGDLLIASAAGGRGPLFIETHSEHILLRLLRRIRERNESGDSPIQLALEPEQLAVLYVDQVDGRVSVTRLRVDETGDFLDRWPRGFFTERAEELF